VNANRSSEIIIIGAGAAGLMAAKELAPHFRVTLLEARAEPGGRIRTTYRSGKKHIEQGAEFVHGRLPVTMDLIRQAGLTCLPAVGNFYQVKDGRWTKSEAMIEGWDELMEKMQQEKEDMTMLAFLRKHYSDEKHFLLRKYISRFAEGFDLADISRVSMKSLQEEWMNESDENFRIEGGYMPLIRFVESECARLGCNIIYNTPARLIEWKEGFVRVYKDRDTVYEAEKVLITIPLGLLQSREAAGAIRFDPAIGHYLDATQEMGYGSVIKFVLDFSTAFWQKKQPDAGFIISEEQVPTWWVQQKDDTLLTGWLGGPPADELINAGKDQLMSVAIHSLSTIFQLSYAEIQEMLIGSNVFNWSHDEWADGGYSYTTPASARVLKLFNTPPGNTIFFGGEGFYEGKSPGTVEAALSNGITVARKIIGL